MLIYSLIPFLVIGIVFFTAYYLLYLVRNKLNKKYLNAASPYLHKYLLMPTFLLLTCIILFITYDNFNYLFSALGFMILSRCIKILLILSIGYFFVNLVSFLKIFIINRYSKTNYKDLTLSAIKTKINIIAQIINFVIFILVASAILLTFDKVKGIGDTLIASAGIVSVIVGFAAQKSLASVFNGLQIALTQSIKIDDNIIIDGKFGTINEINLTHVVVTTWDEKRLIIPTNYFIDNTVENWTKSSQEITAIVKLYSDYATPIDKVRAFFKDLSASHPLWDKRASSFFVTQSNESCIELRATMSARNPSEAFTLECDIREKLIEFLQKNYWQYFPKRRIQLTDKIE